MAGKVKQYPARFSEEQIAAIEKAMKQDGETNKSEALRKAAALYCQMHGVEFPGNNYTWGGSRKSNGNT